MLIIGVDYHPSFQMIAFLIEETGECGEQELSHGEGQAEKFYRDLKQRGPIPTKLTAKIIEASIGVKTWVSKRMARIRHVLTKNILASFLFMRPP
jgi:hypothetical protein